MKRLDEIFTVTYGVNLELCYLTKLPIDKDGEPDYDFMEQYIKSLSFSGNIG